MTNSLWAARVPQAFAVILLLLLPVVFGAPSLQQHEELQSRDDLPEGYYAPPYYPTPPGGWVDEWTSSYAKAAAMVRNMTLAEKVNLTTGSGYEMGRCVGNLPGVPRLGVPVLCLQDGPLGIRSTDNNSAFPAGITTGATFNKDLMYARGVALGEEFRGKGIHIYLGPSVGPLGRKPLGGRNWEGFGADPVLQGYGGSLTVKGVQSQGVIATIKHYIANEQEIMRMQTPVLPIGQPYSSDVDDRTMHELYLWPFAEAVKAGVGAAMASYNAINGSAASQNAYLLNGVLKDELGFQGFVMSDWYGHYTGVASTLAGLDMSMPGEGPLPLFGDSYWAFEMSKAILNGSVPMDRINDIATRVLASWFQMGQDEGYPDVNFSAWTDADEGQLYPGAGISPTGIVNEHVNVQGNHAQVIRQIATEAITLLKNENNTLPLTTSTPLVVFGDDAQANPDGPNSCSDKGCDKGVLGQGWGSGTANYPYLDAPIDALRRRVSNVTAYLTDDFPSDPEVSDGDVALVFINSDSGENYITVEGNPGDRTSDTFYAWHDGDDLVQSAAETYNTVIVIYHTVGPVVMSSWIDLPAVKAVLVAHLPGQEAGDSLTDVLFGDVSPSGHLPYTLPKNPTDYPESVSIIGSQLTQAQDPYTEGLFIDYRYFVTNNISVQYPFGHGLSYSTFTYTSPSITTGEALTSTPPARPAKGSTPSYSDAIPAPSEVYYPDDFTYIRGYLYPYLDILTANAQAALANTSTYPYPQGYSEETHAVPRAGGAQGGNPALWDVMFTVTVDVTNAASSVQGLAAKSVVQAYVKYPDDNGGFETPTLQLRDFAKTSELADGDSETVQIELTRKDLSVWSVEIRDWIIPNPEGRYGVYLGESVEDLRVVCWTDGSGCESL